MNQMDTIWGESSSWWFLSSQDSVVCSGGLDAPNCEESFSFGLEIRRKKKVEILDKICRRIRSSLEGIVVSRNIYRII